MFTSVSILFLIGVISSAMLVCVMQLNIRSLRAGIGELNELGTECGAAIALESGHLEKTAGKQVPPCAGKTLEHGLVAGAIDSISHELWSNRWLLNKAKSGRLKALALLTICTLLLVLSL